MPRPTLRRFSLEKTCRSLSFPAVIVRRLKLRPSPNAEAGCPRLRGRALMAHPSVHVYMYTRHGVHVYFRPCSTTVNAVEEEGTKRFVVDLRHRNMGFCAEPGAGRASGDKLSKEIVTATDRIGSITLAQSVREPVLRLPATAAGSRPTSGLALAQVLATWTTAIWGAGSTSIPSRTS